jgi:hypothetical protein
LHEKRGVHHHKRRLDVTFPPPARTTTNTFLAASDIGCRKKSDDTLSDIVANEMNSL